jgi:hypothetical protein
MAQVDFININTLKENSLIDDNVDAKLLTPTLRVVQDIYLQKILGTPLYEDFKTKITADETLAAYPNHLALMRDYIKNVLIYYVCMHSLHAIRYRMMNKGVMVKNSDNSNPADSLEVKVIKDEFRMFAESYAELLTKYLKENTDTFPLYDDLTETGMNAATTNYTTGIDLD